MDLDWSSVCKLLKGTRYLVLDTENDPCREARLPGSEVTLGVAVAGETPQGMGLLSHYFPVRHRDVNINSDVYQELLDLIYSAEYIIMHNAKHDLVTLREMGVDTSKFKFICTMVNEHMIHGKQKDHGLSALCKKYGLPVKEMPPRMEIVLNMFGKDEHGNKRGWAHVLYEDMLEYSGNDARITLRLFHKQQPYLHIEPFNELWEWEQAFIRVLIKMEQFGILVDKEFCKEQIEIGRAIQEEIVDILGGFNPSSSKDLHFLLIDSLKLPILRTTPKGNPSFDNKAMELYDDMLQEIGSPVARNILEYRGWAKTIGASYEPYLKYANSKDGRFRPSYRLVNTITGRLSAGYAQQIPRMSDKPWNGELKKAFIPAVGYKLWDVDFSQLEFRVIAHYANEQALIEIFNDPKRKLFDEMAAALQWLRDPTKTFVYMVSYGAGIEKIKLTLGVSTDVAERMKKDFFARYRGIAKLFKECMNKYKQNGYIKLWTGRKVRNNEFDKPYAALDYLAQGGGAEIVKRAIVRLDKLIDWNECRLVLTVHDSVVAEIREGREDYWLPIIKKAMEEPPHEDFKVPFPVEIKEWGTKNVWQPRPSETTN